MYGTKLLHEFFLGNSRGKSLLVILQVIRQVVDPYIDWREIPTVNTMQKKMKCMQKFTFD